TSGSSLNLSGSTTLFNQTSGVIQGVGTVSAPVANGGHIAPGSPIGNLYLTGSLNMQDGAELDIDVGVTAAGTQYDQLAVSGAVTLAGTLNVSLSGGFYPANGNQFQVLTFASVTGDFATYAIASSPAGLKLSHILNSKNLTLTAATSATKLNV